MACDHAFPERLHDLIDHRVPNGNAQRIQLVHQELGQGHLNLRGLLACFVPDHIFWQIQGQLLAAILQQQAEQILLAAFAADFANELWLSNRPLILWLQGWKWRFGLLLHAGPGLS